MRRFLRKYLLEIVLVLLGSSFLAALAIPNFNTARDRSRQKKTMADMRTIATALEARATDVNSYRLPSRRGHVEYANLKRVLAPTYIKELPRDDGWGRPLEFITGDQTYKISSLGRDGEPSGFAPHSTTDFDCDIVYQDGTFLQFPEGT